MIPQHSRRLLQAPGDLEYAEGCRGLLLPAAPPLCISVSFRGGVPPLVKTPFTCTVSVHREKNGLGEFATELSVFLRESGAKRSDRVG